VTSTNGAHEREVGALVLGGGICGIGAAIRLPREAGVQDLVVVEKSDRLGGTWWHNTYPGCACDIPSAQYSFEFAPNPGWSRVFAHQPEILGYVERVAEDYGVPERTLFNTEVLGAAWNATRQRWIIDTTRGRFVTPIFVFAPGGLHEPNIPAIPGIDEFHGVTFHTSRWNHEHDLTGRRVAVVGSGASAVQLVGQIQPKVAHLTLLQRTPGWVWPKLDWRTTRLEKALYHRYPSAQRAVRRGQVEFGDMLLRMYGRVELARLLNSVGRAHLRVRVKDPELRATLTPDYVLGCKRVMVDNYYYRAVVKPNVTVVPHGLREVRSTSIVAASGSEHEVDTIIWATGFHNSDHPFAKRLVGRDGHTLAEAWGKNPRAYMGASTTGFPNAFMLFGPNAGTANCFLMLEAQLNYVTRTIRHLRDGGYGSVDIRPEVVDDWKQLMQTRLAHSTWVRGGCNSWYQDSSGDIYTIYGGSMRDMLKRSRQFDPAWFDTRPAQPGTNDSVRDRSVQAASPLSATRRDR
jgi:cation diffusion facilitator CzcD-associated flavoprotein CzcO